MADVTATSGRAQVNNAYPSSGSSIFAPRSSRALRACSSSPASSFRIALRRALNSSAPTSLSAPVSLGVGVLLLGLRRHVAGIAALAARGHNAGTAQELAARCNRLLAYLLAGGAFLCAVFGAITYGILERIDRGFALFG